MTAWEQLAIPEAEIVRRFKAVENEKYKAQREEIRIMCHMIGMEEKDMVELLEKNGCKVKKMGRPAKVNSVFEEEIQEMIETIKNAEPKKEAVVGPDPEEDKPLDFLEPSDHPFEITFKEAPVVYRASKEAILELFRLAYDQKAREIELAEEAIEALRAEIHELNIKIDEERARISKMRADREVLHDEWNMFADADSIELEDAGNEA